jgi:hypothetical protein
MDNDVGFGSRLYIAFTFKGESLPSQERKNEPVERFL